jgi:hypothetical protein
VEPAAVALALASAEELLDCLTPVSPLPSPASLLAPRPAPHADVASTFWRLVFLVLVAVAWPSEAQPLPRALFDAEGGVALGSLTLAVELGVDAAEFGALCRAFLFSTSGPSQESAQS